MEPNPSLIRGGLPIASPGHPVLGTWVHVIDERGHVALGYLEKYNPTLDVFVVHFAEAEDEVTEKTDKSASGRSGDFGGGNVQVSPWLRKSAVYLTDTRFGVERFILSGEDPQTLIDFVNASNAPPPPQLKVDTGQDAGSQGSNAGGTPAPEPAGKVSASAHPDIAPGVVEEPETASIPPEKQKGKLPDDFPGRAALKEAGITKFGQILKVKDLTKIDGIGPATADKIKAALGL